MKSLVRKIIFYGVSLFLLSQLFDGIKISGGILTYAIGAIGLSVMFMTIKPILSILTLPLNIATMGLFSFLINAVILYLLTVLVSNIRISSFTFESLSFAGFVVPKIYINTFFAFIVLSIGISIFVGFLSWLIKK